MSHRPNGGQVQIISEKLNWQKAARIDHLAKNYSPSGGNRSIIDEKLTWNKKSKIDSFGRFFFI